MIDKIENKKIWVVILPISAILVILFTLFYAVSGSQDIELLEEYNANNFTNEAQDLCDYCTIEVKDIECTNGKVLFPNETNDSENGCFCPGKPVCMD